MDPDSRIYLAGHRGLVGSAIHRELLCRGYRKIATRTHEELDLCDEVTVDAFVGRLHCLGWHHSTGLEQGIRRTWETVGGAIAGPSMQQE